VIRQAISCDICGSEKRQTNHWFVVTEQSGELRVSGWGSRNRLRSDTKHLCGQTCLHKLVDEFVARSIAGQHAPAADTSTVKNDASLTAIAPAPRAPAPSRFAVEDLDPPEMLPLPVAVAKPVIVSPVVVPLPVRSSETLPMPAYTSRHSRAEAWERERERTQGHGPRKHF
jgi:hypothetical protein